MKIIINFLIIITLNTALFGAISSVDSADTQSLKSASVSSDVNGQLEKIYNGVRIFHIFKEMKGIWSTKDSNSKTLVTGQNGFPIFSGRSDKDPQFTDYPIDYTSNTLKRYRPVRPPESVKSYYTSNNIKLGDANTSTYNAPIVAGGTIGKGRVVVMGNHIYSSILVEPRNFSRKGTEDSADMENFFHNIMGWLTEQNDVLANRYSKSGSTNIKILSNKIKAPFWGSNYRDFKIHANFKVADGENPKLVETWTKAKEDGFIDHSKYPLIILEDFYMDTSWKGEQRVLERKTALNEVDMIVDYIRAGGGVLMMENSEYNEKYNITETASNNILRQAGVTSFFQNSLEWVKLLPTHNKVGGIYTYNMCVLDYIGHTDLQRRLGMDDYSNVPTTLQGLKDLLTSNGKINYLEEVLGRRERKIFKKGDASSALTLADCGKVEIELGDGSKTEIPTTLVTGDGIPEQADIFDKYAEYPVDLNFAEAQGDVGGSMNTLLAHEKDAKKKMLLVDVNREYTNMSALILNDAVFTGKKFESLNALFNEYKTGGKYVNANGEFYPGFSFSANDQLDFRVKPVTRMILERALYDRTLKYDPSEFPGQKSSINLDAQTSDIYLKRNTMFQKWYAGNMQSTGFYAPAHTDVTITLPAEVDETKMQLQIGVGDNVGGMFRHEINLKRPPKYVKKYKFFANGVSTKTITVQHPYGGLIFLKSFHSSKAEDATASITFNKVQKVVRFVLGKTTEAEWDELKASATAPKAELESNHFIVTVAQKNMSSLSFADVTRIANEYDTMAKNAYDFYGYDQNCGDTFTINTPPSCDNNKKLAHKIREVFDPHISVGDGHSGYPIMVMSWNPASTSFPQNAKNSFLLWHEAGHNMVEGWLSIPGAGEVANNVMAGYQQRKFGITEKSISSANIILAKAEPWADGGNAGRLIMFNQLTKWIDTNYLPQFKAKNTKYYNSDGSVKSEYPFLSGDGFDLYKILHREARDTSKESNKYDACMRQSGKTKTDMLAICTSAILELNTKPWLQAWKAGVIGIGAVDGVNIYDYAGGITHTLDTGVTTSPSPAIETFVGN